MFPQQQVDMQTEEFKTLLAKTNKFVEKVRRQFGFMPNPDPTVNVGVAEGLTRNKIIYGKRFCPGFMVQGETKEEQMYAENRLCPCTRALEVEIPKYGFCHCGIFCSPAFIEEQNK